MKSGYCDIFPICEIIMLGLGAEAIQSCDGCPRWRVIEHAGEVVDKIPTFKKPIELLTFAAEQIRLDPSWERRLRDEFWEALSKAFEETLKEVWKEQQKN